MPTKNPNYDVKETVEELIELFKRETVYVINEDVIIGITDITDNIYYKDGFIYGTILSRNNLNEYEWCNAETQIDGDMRIKKICCVNYKEK